MSACVSFGTKNEDITAIANLIRENEAVLFEGKVRRVELNASFRKILQMKGRGHNFKAVATHVIKFLEVEGVLIPVRNNRSQKKAFWVDLNLLALLETRCKNGAYYPQPTGCVESRIEAIKAAARNRKAERAKTVTPATEVPASFPKIQVTPAMFLIRDTHAPTGVTEAKPEPQKLVLVIPDEDLELLRKWENKLSADREWEEELNLQISKLGAESGELFTRLAFCVAEIERAQKMLEQLKK